MYSRITLGGHLLYQAHALRACEDDIDARLALTSLLLEENRDDEAVKLLSPPPSAVLSHSMHTDKLEPWWLNVKVKLKLSHIYRTKGMLEAFVEVIYPIIHESLKFDSMHQKVLF
ncbi:Pseudouridine-5'-phosphate glycosidase [Bienertia sinuspersici]